MVVYPCWSQEKMYHYEVEFYMTEEEARSAANAVVFGDEPQVFCHPSLAVPSEQRSMRPGLAGSVDDLRDWLAREGWSRDE